MAYDPTIIAAIKQRAAQESDPAKRNRYLRAALQTGIVESGLQNLNHGDADSEGWRQERTSLYKDPTNVTASVNRFFDEAAQLDHGQPSWQLAADVQRPAAQYRGRYKEVAKQAASLLGGGASSSGGAGTTTPAAPSSSGSGTAAAPQALLGAPDQADFTSLLGSLLSGGQPQQQAPAPMQVAPPSFAAHAPTPQGFNPAESSSAPAPQQQDGLSAALSLVGTLGTSTAGVGQGQASQPGIAEQVINGPKGIAETVMKTPSSAKGPDAALAWAKSKVGAPGSAETGGENHGKLADYANSRFGMSGQAWCAMFTSLAVTKGGAPSSARTASVAEVRRRALAGKGYEKGIVSPQAAQSGDLILFGDDHIGMVDRVENGKVYYVGGNQSDSVTEASVPVGKGDIVRPKYR